MRRWNRLFVILAAKIHFSGRPHQKNIWLKKSPTSCPAFLTTAIKKESIGGEIRLLGLEIVRRLISKMLHSNTTWYMLIIY
jgi:hypothetical protein